MLRKETINNVTTVEIIPGVEPEKMPELKTMICQELLGTQRAGMPQLIAHMEQMGYFESPASTASHLCCPSGLAQHSWNVLELAQELNMLFGSPCSEESITICSLLHDLGKSGQFGKPGYIGNILKSGKLSEAKPYEVNKELLPVEHEIRSAIEICKYIQLTEEEQYAILHHKGGYGANAKLRDQYRETKLYMILRFADQWSSSITEQEDSEPTMLH